MENFDKYLPKMAAKTQVIKVYHLVAGFFIFYDASGYLGVDGWVDMILL